MTTVHHALPHAVSKIDTTISHSGRNRAAFSSEHQAEFAAVLFWVAVMKGQKNGVAAVLGIAPLLYVGWLFTWFGTFAGTCTGADPKSLGAGMSYSVLFYAGGILCLLWSKLSTEGALCALPLVGLLLWQAVWSFDLFIVVFFEGHSACTFMMGSYFGEARGGEEYVYVCYYVIVSLASLMAIGLSHYRYRRSHRARAQDK